MILQGANMKLIITDMDGTLLNDKKELDSGFIPLVLKYKNIQFVIASGRQYQNIKQYFKDLNLYYISDNGSFVSDNHQTIITNKIEKDILLEIMDYILSQKDLFPILCTKDCAYISTNNIKFIENAQKYYYKLENIANLTDIAKTQDVGKIAFYDPIDAKTHTFEKLKIFSDKVKITLSAKDWIDFNPLDISKGTALIQLIDILKINQEDVIAFGDYLNDYEMLKVAKISVAMENAVPEIKNIATHKTKTNNENGVSCFLNELLK